MPSLTLPSARIHYTSTGEGPPILLLHANPGDGRDFDAVIPELAERHRVLALDWPGYGRSDPPAHPDTVSVAFLERVLGEFVDALGLPPALLIGNSVGGNVAVRLAAQRPERVRALVLVAPGGFTPQNALTRTFCRWQGSRLALSPRLFARMYLAKRTPVTRAMLARAATLQASPTCTSVNRALWRSFGLPESDLRAVAGNVTCPVLLVFGSRDPVISAKRDGRIATACLPDARLVTLQCGHAPFAEIPDAFLDVVMPFIGRCADPLP